MNKDTRAPAGELQTIDGTQYFVVGKTRIKVTEHFPEQAPTMASLIEDLILYTAKQAS